MFVASVYSLSDNGVPKCLWRQKVGSKRNYFNSFGETITWNQKEKLSDCSPVMCLSLNLDDVLSRSAVWILFVITA